MTWMMWFALGLLAAAFLALVAVVVLLVVFAVRRETYPAPAAEAPDALMGVADGLGFQRSTAWTGDNVTVPRDRTRRLSEGWISYAEEQFDWHAAEYMVRRVK